MNELRGLWFDGCNSVAREVWLSRADDDRLRVSSGSDTWLFALSTVVISPRLGRTPRVLRMDGFGQIECPDDPRLEHWFRAPSRIEAMADWLERRRFAAMASAVLTVAGVVLFFQFGLPVLAERLAGQMPVAVERVMTRQVLALLDRIELKPTRVTPAHQRQLQRAFERLKQQTSRGGGMRLLFRNAPGMGANGFTLPDGTIVLTDGLIDLAKHDDEVIAVLAHEIGHHEYRHIVRQTLESSGIVVMAAVLFGDVSGSSLTISMPTTLLELGFSRNHEREADQFGIGLLKRNRISPQAFAIILRRLSRHQGEAGAPVSGYLSTHPPTPERIARAERAAIDGTSVTAPP